MKKKSPLPDEALEFFRKQGARGGKIGGKRSLVTMNAEQRSERARQAGKKSGEARARKAIKSAATSRNKKDT